jgi:hypothetical protein
MDHNQLQYQLLLRMAQDTLARQFPNNNAAAQQLGIQAGREEGGGGSGAQSNTQATHLCNKRGRDPSSEEEVC